MLPFHDNASSRLVFPSERKRLPHVVKNKDQSKDYHTHNIFPRNFKQYGEIVRSSLYKTVCLRRSD